MSPEQLAADRAVCDAATKGEWRYEDFGDPEYPTVLGSDGHTIVCGLHGGDACIDTVGNARFIAAARTCWPAALDEIERLRAALAKLAHPDDYFWSGRWAQAALDGLSPEEFDETDRRKRELLSRRPEK